MNPTSEASLESYQDTLGQHSSRVHHNSVLKGSEGKKKSQIKKLTDLAKSMNLYNLKKAKEVARAQNHSSLEILRRNQKVVVDTTKVYH
jgi:hypothetical protein